jgi:hypothetical protein
MFQVFQELFPAVIPIFIDKTCFAFYQKRIFPSIWARAIVLKITFLISPKIAVGKTKVNIVIGTGGANFNLEYHRSICNAFFFNTFIKPKNLPYPTGARLQRVPILIYSTIIAFATRVPY